MSRRWVVKQGTTRVETSVLRFVSGTLTYVNGEAVIDVSGGGGGGVPTSLVLTATAPLTGGGNLSANRSFGLSYSTGLTLSGSSLVVDTSVVATLSAVAAGYQPLDADLTALAAGTWAGTSALVTLGTVTTGVWHGTTIATGYGGTGLTSYTAGDLLYATGSTTLASLPVGTNGYILGVVAGLPAYRSPTNARIDLGLVVGTNVQAWDADLDALAALSSTGIIVRTGAGTATTRTITGGTGISVTDGSGVSGNPTVSLTGGSNVDRDETLAHTVMVYPATAIGADNMVVTVVGSALAYDSTSNVAYSTVSGGPGSWSASNWDMLYFGQPSVAYWLCGMQGTLTNATHKIGYRTTGGNTANLIDNTIQALFVYRQASGANWRFITQGSVGGASTDTDTTVAVAASTLYRFRMTVASGGGSVEIGIRTWNTGTLQWGAEVTKTVTTNLPPASTKMGPQQACFNQGGTFYGASFYVTKPFSAGL